VLALLAEERETCPGCGNPMDECRDRATAGTWQVDVETCQACLVAEAMSDNLNESGKRPRGVHIYTRRHTAA
jgi:hypothetical protein